MINIIYDGKKYEYDSGIKITDVLKDVNVGEKNVIAAMINNRLTPLNSRITRNSDLSFCTIKSDLGKKVYVRGLCFLLVKAVKDVLNCDIKIMNRVNNSIYCDILTNNLISEVTVEKIKLKMKELVSKKIPINKINVSRLDAIDYYSKVNQMDKAESLKYISNSSISLYKIDDTLDYFYGILPPNTSYLNYFNVKYIKENKIALLIPSEFHDEEKIKFERNNNLLHQLETNSKYEENLAISNHTEFNKIILKQQTGDVIRMSEVLQNDQMLEIANKIIKNKDKKIVLVNGPVSSGKLITSKKIALFLKSKGYKPITISIVDFYTDLKDRVLNEFGKPEEEKIEAFDTKQFNKKINDLIEGKEVILPNFNFSTGKQELKEENKIKMDDKSILIVEGGQSFNETLTEMIPSKYKFKLYICPLTPLGIDNHNLFSMNDLRLLRRLVRENRIHNKSATEILSEWTSLKKYEEKEVLPYIQDADEIFNTSLPYELGVLKTFVEPLLFSVQETDENYDDTLRLINLLRTVLNIPTENIPDDSILREFIGESCFKNI